MTIRVWIDGWPFEVAFTGTVDIDRMWDGETVAVRGTATVRLDEEELARSEEEIRQVRRGAESWDHDFLRLLEKSYREAMYGTYPPELPK